MSYLSYFGSKYDTYDRYDRGTSGKRVVRLETYGEIEMIDVELARELIYLKAKDLGLDDEYEHELYYM